VTKVLRVVVPAVLLAAAVPFAAGRLQSCPEGPCTAAAPADEAAADLDQAALRAAAAVPAPRLGAWGVDMSGMDRSVRPGEDFFGFVNGTWARTTEIPADRASFGAFAALRDLSEARVRQLVESYPLADPAAGGDRAKIAALYRTFLDEAAVEELDATPLLPRLQGVREVSSHDDMVRLMGQAVGSFGASFFGPAVFDDRKNPDFYALHLGQSGLGLSDRELYLDDRFTAQKERYQQYVAQLLGMIDWPEAEQAAAAVVAMETSIAEAHWTRAESRDRDRTYNLMSVAELERDAPGFPWRRWFDGAGMHRAERAIVAQNTAFPKLAAIFARADLDTLKAWQAFHTTDQAAPLLSRRFVDAHFDFRSRFLQGQPEQRERWKRGVAFVENAMGEAIGRDYVELYYPPESRAIMDEMVANIRLAMQRRIEGLKWMGPATKKEALDKLANFGLKIGYPDTWRDYSDLEVQAGDLFGNAERAQRFEWDFRRDRIGRPVDKGEWSMTPQTVNAYYSPVKNEIVFPAAILQPPFFDPKADAAVNYGAIGAVIGHEVTHGFDDQGRKSDGRGLLRDWWTPEDAKRFEAQAERLGKQYASYAFPTLPDMRINPRVSMGENIADLGGVLVALEAYRELTSGKLPPIIDGFTAEQRFFMGWAQMWRIVWRDEALRQQLVNGPHSPGQIRAFAPLRNVDAWYTAFGIKPGEKLHVRPEDRVRIW
jgi:putative endopeptidase